VLRLDFCTKQVVSARAYANQFLSYNSLRIKIIDMRTLQAYSCLNSEQIDTHFNSVGGQERGVWGVGGHFGPEAKNLHVTVRNCFFQEP
jgi:hypothetical protein